MDNRYFSFKLVEWYDENHRKLPWRESGDPYRIWLSEVLLQQTRVAQGLPYYLRFVERFPTVNDLARARESEILRLWQGLGYYSRARNLLRCAREVVDHHDGLFPTTYEDLLKLPGIGSYTAAAIASIASGVPVAVLDGNVFRVLARIWGLDHDIASPAGKQLFFQKAQELLDRNRPGLHNQALMEFGALHCTPRKPQCGTCPFAEACVARRDGLQAMLPVKKPKAKIRKRYFYYFVVGKDGKIGMRQRQGNDIWKNLYDFYLVEKSKPFRVEKIIESDDWLREISGTGTVTGESPVYHHVLTHQRISAKFVHLQLKKSLKPGPHPVRLFSPNRIENLPKPALVLKYLEDYNIL